MLQPGVYAAAVTPLDQEGRPDHLSLARHLAYLEHGGCIGAVIGGTNGEGPSLSAPTKRDLIRVAVRAKGKLQIVVGIATASLEEATWLCQQAAKAGADGALVMPPAYFRCVPENAITEWFMHLFEASPIPVLAYNFPQMTGIEITPSMLHYWKDCETFAGLKDSSGDPANLTRYPSNGELRFVGDETLLPQAMAAGWSGSISGVANVIPKAIVRLTEEPNYELAITAARVLRALPQPATHKAVLHALGVLTTPMVCPPLSEATPAQLEVALTVLKKNFGIEP